MGSRLVELLVVITIIALIAAIALPIVILPALNERRRERNRPGCSRPSSPAPATPPSAPMPREASASCPTRIFNGQNGMPLAS